MGKWGPYEGVHGWEIFFNIFFMKGSFGIT